jgi:hypothetical protein
MQEIHIGRPKMSAVRTVGSAMPHLGAKVGASAVALTRFADASAARDGQARRRGTLSPHTVYREISICWARRPHQRLERRAHLVRRSYRYKTSCSTLSATPGDRHRAVRPVVLAEVIKVG